MAMKIYSGCSPVEIWYIIEEIIYQDGRTDMSVVNLMLHNTCALLLSDTKLNNNAERNKIKKIFKKENILLGFTGNIQDVYLYLHPIFNKDMTLNNAYVWGNPCDFFTELDRKFYTAMEDNKEYDVVFVAGAKFGDKYIAKRYCLSNEKELRFASDMIVSSDDIQYFYLGEDVHLNYFEMKMKENTPTNLDDIVLLFNDTINYGVQYDGSINNQIDIEYINTNSFL
jgi:hypothetical protein